MAAVTASAAATSYVAFPSELLSSPLFSLPVRVRTLSSSCCDVTDTNCTPVGHQQTISRHSSTAAAAAVTSSHPTTTTSTNKKVSRPLELLRWLTSSKTRRKDRDITTTTTTSSSCVYTESYLSNNFIQEQIVEPADLVTLVALPGDIDCNEWIASHTISFFDNINTLYGCISQFCVHHSSLCSTMTGPLNIEYQLVDDRGKRSKCSASQYVDNVMSLCHRLVADENLFPTKYGNVFPSSFESTAKKIFRLLLHVVGHIYHAHWKQVLDLRLHGHLNTTTYHFLLFARHFRLVEDKELQVFHQLFTRLEKHHNTRQEPCVSVSQPDVVVSSSPRHNGNDMVTGGVTGVSCDMANGNGVVTTQVASSGYDVVNGNEPVIGSGLMSVSPHYIAMADNWRRQMEAPFNQSVTCDVISNLCVDGSRCRLELTL